MSPAAYFLSPTWLLIVPSPQPCCLPASLAAPPRPAPWPLQHNSFEPSDHTSPSPVPNSNLYPPLELEPHHPESSTTSISAGGQPNAGHAPAGKLPGHAAMEAEQRPLSDDAPLPTVAARHGAVFKVEFIGGGGSDEDVNLHTTENSDLQVTLI